MKMGSRKQFDLIAICRRESTSKRSLLYVRFHTEEAEAMRFFGTPQYPAIRGVSGDLRLNNHSLRVGEGM